MPKLRNILASRARGAADKIRDTKVAKNLSAAGKTERGRMLIDGAMDMASRPADPIEHDIAPAGPYEGTLGRQLP